MAVWEFGPGWPLLNGKMNQGVWAASRSCEKSKRQKKKKKGFIKGCIPLGCKSSANLPTA